MDGPCEWCRHTELQHAEGGSEECMEDGCICEGFDEPLQDEPDEEDEE